MYRKLHKRHRTPELVHAWYAVTVCLVIIAVLVVMG